jgi:hypothetical protein
VAAWAIHSIKRLTVVVFVFSYAYPNGTVAVTQEIKVENRKGFLKLLGNHHGLWRDGEVPNFDDVLELYLGIPTALLPAKLDEPDAIDAEAVATFLDHEPTPQECIVSNPLTRSKVELMKQDEKSPRENALQGYQKLNRG